MKKYFLVLSLLFISCKGIAQKSQSQTESIMSSQNAEFPGGDSAFTQEFLKMIHAYIDLDKYAVHGQFVFVFDVGTDGKISQLDVLPKVKNSQMFIEDMQFAIKKVKKKMETSYEKRRANSF
jgi:hypothetical protein